MLKGYAISAVHLVDVDKVRSLIPSELNIISVLPGKTLSVVYVSHYGSGSVLEYSELIVIPAMVSYEGKFGGWVSHIYVDNPDSVAGGREIWGLPKEMAEFTWEDNKRVTVCQGNQVLCSLDYKQQSLAWRQWLGGSAFSTMGNDLLMFGAQLESRLGLIGSKLQVPAESPFAGINFGQPFLTVRCEEMSLQIAAPEVVGQTNFDRITNQRGRQGRQGVRV
ncbi:MAG: acetoacetate decarboxylase family protein [Tolypothrix carrinoi HA7290-LM1]|jgi:hypothetical protein|nr:acetoacetate decarboxylase family protein [Tolypothrix carrinoi HA7290-LM1]